MNRDIVRKRIKLFHDRHSAWESERKKERERKRLSNNFFKNKAFSRTETSSWSPYQWSCCPAGEYSIYCCLNTILTTTYIEKKQTIHAAGGRSESDLPLIKTAGRIYSRLSS